MEYNNVGIHISSHLKCKKWICNSSIGVWKKKNLFNMDEISKQLEQIARVILQIYLAGGQIWIVDFKDFTTTPHFFDILEKWNLLNIRLVSGKWIDGRVGNITNFELNNKHPHRKPSIIILVNFDHSRNFLKEIGKAKIPVIGLLDTNINFELIKKVITYPLIVSNCEKSVIFLFCYLRNFLSKNIINVSDISRIVLYKTGFQYYSNIINKGLFSVIAAQRKRKVRNHKLIKYNIPTDRIPFFDKKHNKESYHWALNRNFNNQLKLTKTKKLRNVPIARKFKGIMFTNKTHYMQSLRYNYKFLSMFYPLTIKEHKRLVLSTSFDFSNKSGLVKEPKGYKAVIDLRKKQAERFSVLGKRKYVYW